MAKFHFLLINSLTLLLLETLFYVANLSIIVQQFLPLHLLRRQQLKIERLHTTSKKFFAVASIHAFGVGGIAFLSLIVLVIFVCCLKKSKRSNDIPKIKAETEDSISKSFGSGVMEAERNKLFFFKGCSYCFKLEDLLKDSAEVLGKGSYVTTYKAALEEGITVVVGKKEFEQQMEVVGRICRHSNVIPLLVYDYMHGGSSSFKSLKEQFSLKKIYNGFKNSLQQRFLVQR